jgi:hypothetical protein
MSAANFVWRSRFNSMVGLASAMRDPIASDLVEPNIDWLIVLKRLCAWARLRLLFYGASYRRDDFAIKGLGDGPDQIATEVWEDACCGRLELRKGGNIDTEEAVRLLISHLKRRFLDRARRQRDGETVMVWNTEVSLDDCERVFSSQDQDVLLWIGWKETRLWLIEAASKLGDPLLRRYIDLQYPEDGFMGFTRRESAQRLGVTPDVVTNIQKKFQRLLKVRNGG